MNIILLLQMAADAGPDRVGLVCDGRRWTYSALYNAAKGAAELFVKSGCAHVALLDESSEAAPIALFGAAIAGIPYVPLNYRLADADLGALLDRVKPAYVIGDVDRVNRLSEGHTCASRDAFVAAAEAAAEGASDEEREGEGIAAQIFTSGTTAAPKAALLRHSNLLGYILGTVEFMAAAEEDAQLVCVPPYHIAGISALLSSIYAMRRIVMLPAFDPDSWLKLAEEEQVTNAFLVPTMLARIIARMAETGNSTLPSVQAIAYGGGRMPPELIAQALDLFPNCNFTNAYGLTETSSTIALLTPEDHRTAHQSDDPKVRARLGSVGKPLPTVELEIRDDEGNVLPAGERGEIYVRGEQVSGEYREKSALDADGWFPTRDAGYLDDEGYLFLAGRADDVIVRGGENISPGEIEDVLATHPAIADSVAVGAPSVEWGEAVAIAVVVKPDQPAPSEDELKIMIKDRLRSSRVPEKIRIVDELPYNEMGKLLRRVVREWFTA
ncbi:class I adenylate-forming enzyme family protein [Halioxenophilus sp. WMMB6]|uniref:class I adenylate-forming enzyme family protein n=1 Tax=Halioxenophilus sp. WMMB6 TaxID=3073815 RepID=UPI00295EB278|nr:class I adenylate-forming enzyme family protein [Halioxenophilus sp. WMMB6]